MRTSTKLYFASAALLITVSCYLQFYGLPGGGLFLLLGMFSYFLSKPHSEFTRPIRRTDLWGILIGVAILVAFIAFTLFVPSSVGAATDRGFFHSAFVVGFWLLMLGSLYGIYRRRKEKASA